MAKQIKKSILWFNYSIDLNVLLVSAGEDPRECPALTDFLCGNKSCIESQFICDYKPDCEDLLDEADCSKYLFVY